MGISSHQTSSENHFIISYKFRISRGSDELFHFAMFILASERNLRAAGFQGNGKDQKSRENNNFDADWCDSEIMNPKNDGTLMTL